MPTYHAKPALRPLASRRSQRGLVPSNYRRRMRMFTLIDTLTMTARPPVPLQAPANRGDCLRPQGRHAGSPLLPSRDSAEKGNGCLRPDPTFSIHILAARAELDARTRHCTHSHHRELMNMCRRRFVGRDCWRWCLALGIWRTVFS